MICKILNKLSLKENRRRYLNLKGILSKHHVYKGPDVVQIDLTDRCNSNCLICWLHFPLVKAESNNELDFSVLKYFLNDLAKSGTKEVIFSGGGEPFFYPRIWEALELAEQNGLVFRINTNFTLLDKEGINRLLSFKNLISLTVSVWAGNADLYSKLHQRSSDVFHKVKDNLKFLNSVKPGKLDVKICAIINNINYLGLDDLLDFSRETGCNSIEFGVADIIPGITDSFLLSKEQLEALRKDFIKVSRNLSNKRIFNAKLFLKRISNPLASCGEYDTSIDQSSCCVGWLFLRLRANGDFNSCLKSHRIPIGNIYKDSFSSVWDNALQREFRSKSLSADKDKEYFKQIGSFTDRGIGCKRVCDNILMNISLKRIIKCLAR